MGQVFTIQQEKNLLWDYLERQAMSSKWEGIWCSWSIALHLSIASFVCLHIIMIDWNTRGKEWMKKKKSNTPKAAKTFHLKVAT